MTSSHLGHRTRWLWTPLYRALRRVAMALETLEEFVMGAKVRVRDLAWAAEDRARQHDPDYDPEGA